ncbi:hypothetical protein SAMN04488510_1352 [Fervidobacterium changbaicum]|uniref:Uncharacterized protein n=1 Tax=Fervidobacterium changbaicum TaxID=310769 RepID=A0ABX5QU98_9BACT|nr:hypothetical protein [Fervidobacterium changbaicum]QAV34013.1 hypothetical protein CBS1_10110 [Fervidobacterium changbaicum]SDH79151.1 hypothetical protein SAMN04488510_1352 [Fervidobacterium changbaicum]
MSGGFENEDEKLKNLLKLKEELEKDLKKKGLLKEKKSEKQKVASTDEETIKKLKESVVTTAHLSEEKSLTLYDINCQDYDASIDDVIKTLRTFMNKTTNMNLKIIYEGLSRLLEGNIAKAKESFQQATGVEAKYNTLLAAMYNGEDISQEAVMFLKTYPEQIYSLLLLLERELLKGTGEGIEKLLILLSRKSTIWNLIYELYLGKASEDSLAAAVREKGFASLMVLLGVYIDSSRDYPIQNHTCLNVHKAYLRGETITAPEWCVFGQLAVEARKFLAGYQVDLNKIRRFERTPEGKLFLGMLYLNMKNHTIAEQYLSAFEKQVGAYKLYAKPLKQSKIGMEQFIHIPNDFQPVGEGKSILQFIEENTGYDIYVNFRNVEFVRLMFSEEHCKISYSHVK